MSLRDWINKNVIMILVGIVVVAVLGNVGSSLFNSSSLHNLTVSIRDIDSVQKDLTAGQLRTSCRTAVQADYDDAIGRLFMGSLVEQRPEIIEALDPEQAATLREYKIDVATVANFADSVKELTMLADGKICVGDNPLRANGEKPGTPHIDDVDGKD